MDFTWEDGERVIRFGRGAIATAPDLLGDGYMLLTTPRAETTAPEVAALAGAVRHVPPGNVDRIAAELLPEVTGPSIVALGGGRVIDTAKAIAGVTGARVAAVPTTLSAAEMTHVHALPAGVDGARHVRPAIVLNDPALCGSQPEPQLAASAANSLAHAIEAPLTTKASPVPTLAAREAQRLIDVAYLVEDEPRGAAARDQLALAALLSGYAIDAAHYGLHHVLAQTVRRVADIGHGQANAALLPRTIAALESLRPGLVDPDGTLQALATRLARLAGAPDLRTLGVTEGQLERCAQAAAGRAELDLTPPRPDAETLLAIYRTAF